MVSIMHSWAHERAQLIKYVQYGQELADVSPNALVPFLPEGVQYGQITNPVVRRYLAGYLLNKLGIESFPIQSLELPLKQWLFLPTETLISLKLLLGALFCNEEIKKVVTKHERDQILSLLGPSLYQCILKRASLFVPLFPKDVSPPDIKASLIEKIQQTGQFFIEYSLCESPKQLLKRFSLKFDPDIPWNFEHPIKLDRQVDIISLCNLLLQKELKS